MDEENISNSQEKKEVNEGNDFVLKAQVPVKVFLLRERKAAVLFSLRTRGQMFIWATDGHSDWLKRGDTSPFAYCIVIVDPAYNLPDKVLLATDPPIYDESQRQDVVPEDLEKVLMEVLPDKEIKKGEDKEDETS